MILYHSFTGLPQISMAYSVIRRTVWRIADPYQILIFVRSGHCRIQTDGKEYLLSPGDLFSIPPDIQYERSPVGEEFCEMFYVHFRTPVPGEALDEDEAQRRLTASREPGEEWTLYLSTQTSFKPEALEGSFQELVKYTSEGGWPERQLAAAILCRMLAMISRQTVSALYKQTDPNPKHPPNLKKALNYIAQHYTEKITLEELCRVSFVSKQMLIRYFHQEFGKTPITYIIEYKIDKIREMLITYPEVSVKELCGEFGFDDQCYFSRIFKKVTGESPTEYRRRVLQFDEGKHLKGL